jgi:16S rRNA (guanine527-N7)-methyltransferase
MDEKILRKLYEYAAMLGAANERVRVTGPADPDTLFDEHISDALAALHLLPRGCSFVDVGTGGGLPGLVWGICRPDTRGTLIDSVRKKSGIVAEMARALDCPNVEVVNMRSEDFANARREKFDVAAARAVARSGILAEYLSPLVRKGGRLVAFKGPAAAEEVNIPGAEWKILGLSKPKLLPYSIANREYFLVIWEKQWECPTRYPRRPGAAERNPWWSAPG